MSPEKSTVTYTITTFILEKLETGYVPLRQLERQRRFQKSRLR